MRLQGRTLLVALSLLTSAATAHAECAWVLWRRETSMGYGLIDEKPWLLVRAAPTYNACEVAQAEFIKKMVTFWAKVGPDTVSATGNTGAHLPPGVRR